MPFCPTCYIISIIITAGEGATAINAKVIIPMLLAAILFVACGGEEVTPTPDVTRLPTLTPTLRSTPLPTVASPVPIGSDERPIRLGFVAENVRTSTVNQLEEALNELIDDFVVEVEVYPSQGTALDAICDGTEPTAAWVNSFTYIAAEMRCDASPQLGLEIQPGEARLSTFDIIYSTDLIPQPSSLTDIAGKTWCRIDATDTISWIYPSMTMQTAGINPLADLLEIVEVEDYQAMIQAILDEECDLGAIPRGTLIRWIRQIERADRVSTAGFNNHITINLGPPTNDLARLLDGHEPWPVIPHDVLVLPSDVVIPPAFRSELVAAVEELLEDEDSSIQQFLTYDTIARKTPSDYDTFRSWLLDSNWAMSR